MSYGDGFRTRPDGVYSWNTKFFCRNGVFLVGLVRRGTWRIYCTLQYIIYTHFDGVRIEYGVYNWGGVWRGSVMCIYFRCVVK